MVFDKSYMYNRTRFIDYDELYCIVKVVRIVNWTKVESFKFSDCPLLR